MNTGPRPARTAARAVVEALSLVGSGTYQLGARDADSAYGIYDCFSFAVRHCYGLPGHRPMFNRGWTADANFPGGASVVDDLNSNSAIEDAFHAKELFELASGDPREGDLLAYPTIRLTGNPGVWIGHVQICTGVSRVRNWNAAKPQFGLLDVVECVGPNGHIRAIRKSTGSVLDVHNAKWPKPQHRGYLLRVKP